MRLGGCWAVKAPRPGHALRQCLGTHQHAQGEGRAVRAQAMPWAPPGQAIELFEGKAGPVGFVWAEGGTGPASLEDPLYAPRMVDE